MNYFFEIYSSAVLIGLWIQICLFFMIFIMITFFKKNKISLFFDYIFEKMYLFFAEIIGTEKKGIQIYVLSLFFIILFSNITWVLFDFIAPIFWFTDTDQFYLGQYIVIPTTSITFNMGVAIVSILVIIWVQAQTFWIKKFIYNILPIFWKKYIEVERGNMKGILYYPLNWVVKIFDIVISLFLALLDILGYLAKIISLSLRLFWNMTSSWALLVMLIMWMWFLTEPIFWFEFPIWFPLLIYAQELLVALIQAVVFSLLVAVFIKVGKTTEW